ncbi:MAG: class I SAM-dependent methyltransferase [Porphyrobacter sp.]|jgi:hypothetical protein|nr:class I SAM-dependent methyltransferase [Porphyrobacter sp.]
MSINESQAAIREAQRKDRIYKILKEPNSVKRYIFRRYFKAFEALGIHVTADHFYEPIPNLADINKSWSDARRPVRGIDFHQTQAEALAVRILETYGPEFSAKSGKAGFSLSNPYYSGIDALSLYCFVRDHKPNKVIEIGAGASTRLLLAALHANAEETGVRPELISIDPFARFTPEEEVNVTFSVLPEALQAVQAKLAGELGEGDLLFIDSTHVHKFGSDVETYFDTTFPALPKGVMVHVHDIFTPYYYPKDWMTQHKRFWNEQFFLEAFLSFNDQFAVVLPMHLMMRESEQVRALARQHIPGDEARFFVGQSFFFHRKAG